MNSLGTTEHEYMNKNLKKRKNLNVRFIKVNFQSKNEKQKHKDNNSKH